MLLRVPFHGSLPKRSRPPPNGGMTISPWGLLALQSRTPPSSARDEPRTLPVRLITPSGGRAMRVGARPLLAGPLPRGPERTGGPRRDDRAHLGAPGPCASPRRGRDPDRA